MKKHAINGIIAIAGLAVGFGLSLRPWHALQAQRKSTQKNVMELRHAEAAREEALRKEARYSEPVGREELARAQGWQKPGELAADRDH